MAPLTHPPCYDQCCFRDPADGRSFIPGYYSRPRTEKGQRQDDKGRVTQGCCEEEERQGGEKRERDIDDEDGTGEHADAKNRESPDLDVETANTQRATTPGTEGREQGAARRAPGDHIHVQKHTEGRQEGENGEDKGGGKQGEGDHRQGARK